MADDISTSEIENNVLPRFQEAENDSQFIEGDIHIPGAFDEEDELNTLDEPVSETLVSIMLKFILFRPTPRVLQYIRNIAY